MSSTDIAAGVIPETVYYHPGVHPSPRRQGAEGVPQARWWATQARAVSAGVYGAGMVLLCLSFSSSHWVDTDVSHHGVLKTCVYDVRCHNIWRQRK